MMVPGGSAMSSANQRPVRSFQSCKIAMMFFLNCFLQIYALVKKDWLLASILSNEAQIFFTTASRVDLTIGLFNISMKAMRCGVISTEYNAKYEIAAA